MRFFNGSDGWTDLQADPCWEKFTKAFFKEFGPSEFEDFAESLFKLRQTGILEDYIAEFCRLANRTSDIDAIFLKSCFLGGSKRELKFDVKILRLANVHEAIAFAVQLEKISSMSSN